MTNTLWRWRYCKLGRKRRMPSLRTSFICKNASGIYTGSWLTKVTSCRTRSKLTRRFRNDNNLPCLDKFFGSPTWNSNRRTTAACSAKVDGALNLAGIDQVDNVFAINVPESRQNMHRKAVAFRQRHLYLTFGHPKSASIFTTL